MARISIDRFAAVAVRRGFLSRQQLEAALKDIGLEAARNRHKLIAALVRRKDLSTASVERILQLLRGHDLWCSGCKEVRAIDRFDPQKEYACPTCAKPLRRVDGLDRQSNLRIDEVFDEMDDENSSVRLSRWKILRRIGAGGMGRVYLAKHRKLKKLAAVKVLPSDLASDPEYVKLFIREGRALARLKHPNIVEIFDIDQEAGIHFLIMEYVEGVSLKELLEQSGTVAPRVAVGIAMDLSRALVHAHARSFVHRDIKPGNILLGRSGEVKLTDFGLVREMGPDAATWTDAVLGTPHYMSPEQARGRPADIRSDIYSFGATLYMILAGTTPFTGQDTMTVLLKVANDTPPEVRELNPLVPRPLSDLIARMMAKNPVERPQSAADVFRELERVSLNGRATGTRPKTRTASS